VIGWKEYEMEVVRDRKDNCIIICSIENLDPMGVHTGDSITVAPAQTLTDKEYQIMRDASIACLREIGVETGGSNVQFAINPKDGRMVIIEMNPRVSRPRRSLEGHGLPDRQDRGQARRGLHAGRAEERHHRAGHARVLRAEHRLRGDEGPRFAFEKFPQADDRLTTQMKSVGEVMAIGRNFQESLQKALRGLEVGVDGFNLKSVDMDKIEDELAYPRARAPLVRGRRLRRRACRSRTSTLHEDRSVVPGADQGPRGHRARDREEDARRLRRDELPR
jgi:carbamoyl-phosphate synthase large subunit